MEKYKKKAFEMQKKAINTALDQVNGNMAELARRIGISRQQISYYYVGSVGMPLRHVMAVADIAGNELIMKGKS